MKTITEKHSAYAVAKAIKAQRCADTCKCETVGIRLDALAEDLAVYFSECTDSFNRHQFLKLAGVK